MCGCGHSGKNSTGNEAFLTAIALIGFFVMYMRGDITSMSVIWAYAGALGIFVLFYFLLMLARAIFTFMVGSDQFWWKEYADQDRARSNWPNHTKSKK